MKSSKQDLFPVSSLAQEEKKRIAKKAKQSKPPSAVKQRMLSAAARILDPEDSQSVLYSHSILCQTYFPPRNPGDDCHTWERTNGDVKLLISAGVAMHPETREFVSPGLPYGPKARTLIMYLNQKAMCGQSPVIEVDNSLTGFVRNTLRLHPQGANISAVKDQLARLASSSITLGYVRDGIATTVNSRIASAFNIWFPKDDRQRVLWPSAIVLSSEYFESLMNHAVPLDESHIAALSHSSMALDIYTWLAQRLHRIPANRPQLVSWPALYEQFGQGYNAEKMFKFRQVFRNTLKEVLALYSTAKIEDGERSKKRRYSVHGQTIWREDLATGLTLYNSPPPVRKLLT